MKNVFFNLLEAKNRGGIDDYSTVQSYYSQVN